MESDVAAAAAPEQSRGYHRAHRDRAGTWWWKDTQWNPPAWMWWSWKRNNWMWQDADTNEWYPNWQGNSDRDGRWSNREEWQEGWSTAMDDDRASG